MGNSPHTALIHILGDDSLLNIFCLYRPDFLFQEMDKFDRLLGGMEQWVGGRWWYRLAQVCQRWRNLILGSASYLRLSLVCSNGTPVANMLARSPPLPLTVDYFGEGGIPAEDEEGLMLALEQRNRVRHLRLSFPVWNLQKLVMAIDGDFPILEYLIVVPPVVDSKALMLRKTLQSPHLNHLALRGFTCPIGPRLHPTAVGLVTLYLVINHLSAYLQPNILLQWISFMPQLEMLLISFTFPVPDRDVERPTTTPITLPNLRWLWFEGVSAYLEAIVCRVTAPRLKSMHIVFLKQLTFSVPRLVQFVNTAENVRFNHAVLCPYDKIIEVAMGLYGAKIYVFAVQVDEWPLNRQVSSMAQILNQLSQVFSPVERLTLRCEEHSQSSEGDNEVDRIEWRRLLRSFNNVKILRVEDGLVKELSRCLRSKDGELPLELFPELQELTYYASGDTGDAFTSFVEARQDAGRPVTLIRHSPRPSLSESRFEAPVTASASSEAGSVIEA